MNRFAKLHYISQGLRPSKLEVNDQDILHQVRGMQFEHKLNDVPRFYVDFISDDVEIQGEGVVYVQRGQDVSEFLAAVDIQMLEAAVLESSEWGESPVATAVNLLRKWAGGNST